MASDHVFSGLVGQTMHLG